MYNYVDKNYDVIIPYTHTIPHVIIIPLEIIIIHYTICLTYNTFNRITRGLCTFKVLFICVCILIAICTLCHAVQ